MISAATSDGGHVVIVGAGATGLVTAVRCLIDGHSVTLIDKDGIPSPSSTSFDEHRVIRALDPTDAVASADVYSMHRLWSELEDLLCTQPTDDRFYRKVGAASAWDSDTIESVLASAADARIPVEPMDAAALHHIRFTDDPRVVREIDAGVLLADRSLLALSRYLTHHPDAQLHPHREVIAVDVDAARVEVEGGLSIDADAVLIAAGPWSHSLVDVETTLFRQTMVYLRPPNDLACWWYRQPTFGRLGEDHAGWLVPPGRGSSLKISTDAVCREVADLTVDDGPATAWAAAVVATSPIVDIDAYAVTAVKQCHYAVDAATGGASMVQLGPAVWARAASGGDGFRTAPSVADHILNFLRPPIRPTEREL